jgi:Glycosyl hydrolase catalytic core
MRRIALLALVVTLAGAAGAEAADRRVPRGWLGVTADGPFQAGDAGEWDRMVGAGVESVRTAFYWAVLQPYRTEADVPAEERLRFRIVDGVPTDFSSTDAIVAAAAQRGLAVLPVVQFAPGWAARVPGKFRSPPRRAADVTRFFRTLVERYGPGGSLWTERPELPRVPIRGWQVFNEPNLKGHWPVQPFARSYTTTLRGAERGIHAADPAAAVVLAGLTHESWKALKALYRAGARGAFDAVAIHPYTARPADVLRIVRYNRRVMQRYGDRKLPIWITELSWPAAGPRMRDVPRWASADDSGQARLLREAMRRLERARTRLRIGGVYWYSWLTTETKQSWFGYSGLRRIRRNERVDTPGLREFRRSARRLQGCAKAQGDARRCA